jgi:DNA polymerase-1
MTVEVGILIDEPSFSARKEGRLLTGFEHNFLLEKCAKAGLMPSDIAVFQLGKQSDYECNLLVTMGERPLTAITGKKSIWKWHLSPLDGLAKPYGLQRTVPTFDFNAIWKDWSLGLYLEMALKRAAHYAIPCPWERKEECYVLGPSPDEAIARLEALSRSNPEWLSIDIETGRNQINTFGVAWSGSEAIAVKVLPDDIPPQAFHKLWSCIQTLCESDTPKVMQNGIYERMYLSRYGILINNFKHDTMVAQKFLWPELEKGLDNVGRIYTMEPYWKDDGRVSSEEGKQKDWGDIRDWDRHFRYNCKDTSNTLLAMYAQRTDLQGRGLSGLYENYISRLFDPIYEMGALGLPLDTDAQAALITEYEARSVSLVKQLSAEINPRSPKAKLKLLKDKGYTLPTKRATGKESTDELSLKKLRLKHPEDKDLQILLEVAGIEKALSSYLRVRTLNDKRIRFMLDPHGTETGRMSCSNDPWGGGFNAQTMTDYVKKMIAWRPDEDRVFIEIDLSQAESRFVAYDACEETLLGMLERREDIHKYVAAEIYGKPMIDVTHDERQLGKKSGHGANYSMGVATFQDSCLKEMDLVLDKRMAGRVLESYHKLFPGIRRWHARIRETVYRERCLTNPLGRVRYFYGRTDDNTYREAYAYRPQSTVPDITNSLMLALCAQRTEGAFDFWLHGQIHDSVLLSCRTECAERIMQYAHRTEKWHPEIVLPAGRLVIPTESKWGRCLGDMKKHKL